VFGKPLGKQSKGQAGLDAFWGIGANGNTSSGSQAGSSGSRPKGGLFQTHVAGARSSTEEEESMRHASTLAAAKPFQRHSGGEAAVRQKQDVMEDLSSKDKVTAARIRKRRRVNAIADGIMDIEELKASGEDAGYCPYYLSR